MSALEQFQAGQLTEAIVAQTEQVKKRPTDADARFELFVLLCFAGDLERAEKQLDVLGKGQRELELGSVVFRNLLSSELERRRVHAGERRPVLPPGCPSYVAKRVDALHQLVRGDDAAAAGSIEEAIRATSPTPGRIDDLPFEQICDFDDVLGDVIEVFAGGRYLWLPVQHVRRLEMSEPVTALDTLWVPAQLEDAAGENAQVHVPALYADSHAHATEGVRLGRETEWEQRGPLYRGSGQRILLCASGDTTSEHPFLSIRRLEIPGGQGA
jgi:type VI secretion system protein ImpE